MPVFNKRVAAVLVAVSSLALASAALAQAKKPAAPAAAAKPAAPAAAAPAPAGAQRVELLPAQPDWTKVCGKDQGTNKEICYTTRDFGVAADQPPVLALAVYDVKDNDEKIIRLLLPPALLLRPGIRINVDKGSVIEGGFEICFPNGCFAESKVRTATINAVKTGTTLNVLVKNQFNGEVVFAVPLAGFGKSYDGPAIDPKVLEEQQKQLQDQMQKQADEERKRLESQAPGAAPAPSAAPAPAPAPAR